MPAVSPVEGGGVTATERTAAPVGGSDLAVLVLQVSWALADAAHDLPAGRMSVRQRVELADTVQALGFILRATAADGAR